MRTTDLPIALLRTVLGHIAVLLLQGANGNHEEAWEAAECLIHGHAPRTEVELHLVYRIIAFNLQVGQALAQAAQPDMPLNRVLRLRSGAATLARAADKAERALEKLRAASGQGQGIDQGSKQGTRGPQSPEQARSEALLLEPAPSAEKVGALLQENQTVGAYAKAHGISFTEALRRRARDKRVAERERQKIAQALAATPATA
ncbi:MAG TPA: hypothetical protein VHB27_04695 [Rhodopila sp.]|uniref:hypothetical protein n=1 Tax=Rhodopila sp. TaxID=2480087 RepID=UPI002BCCA143|nr:hypothetical protein [Rhodopila sp.]HVY14501.1 hypothetical protein [Rhodopila sp.]